MADWDTLRKDIAQLQTVVLRIEHRLDDVEQVLGIRHRLQEVGNHNPVVSPTKGDDLDLEFRLGELWVGHLGVGAILVGIAFLISYPLGIHGVFQIAIGYVAVGCGLWMSKKWVTAYPSISRTLFVGSLMLLYFTTLRLHFFADEPLVPQKSIGLFLLILPVVYVFYVAAHKRSEVLNCLAIVLALTTALCTDTTHFAFITIMGACATSVFFRLRYGWVNCVLFALCATYVTLLIWLFNNPFLGHSMQLVSELHGSLFYLFVYGALFGISNLPRRDGTDADIANIALTLLNGAGFYVLGLLMAYSHYKSHFAFINLIFSLFFWVLSTAYWLYRESRFSTAFYACFGYIALSLAIITHFDSPMNFVWLGWQSLLVISTAIWYRSKIVVVSNVFIYLGILIFYLLFAHPNLMVNLSYALVALLSARIMNWQKERLTLQTELMRNIYLASAFVV
ncbi:MAG: hypothetical protein ACO36I_01890, partial [Candidatus Latescibacterota bacterium]